MAGRRLAHLTQLEAGEPFWAYPRYITPGPAQTMTVLDQPDGVSAASVNRFNPSTGVVETFVPQSLPSSTRVPRIAAFHASNPAIFQSYFRVRWEGLTGLSANLEEGARSLQPNKNPNAKGKAEGQALMSYNPWPSAGELYPKAI